MAIIPPFQINGTLPPGIHPATLAELLAAFPPINQQRQILNDSLERVIQELQQWDASLVILVDGSYITKKAEPNDVDLLLITPYHTEPKVEAYLDQHCPVEAVSIDINVEPVMPNGILDVFTTTRTNQAKGIVQIV